MTVSLDSGARALQLLAACLSFVSYSIVGSLVGIVAEPSSSALLLRSRDSRTSSRWCSRCWRWLYPVVSVLYSLPRSHVYRASFARPLVRRFHRGFPFASLGIVALFAFSSIQTLALFLFSRLSVGSLATSFAVLFLPSPLSPWRSGRSSSPNT